MTGYTVHTGSSDKFSEAWDRIFSKGAKAAESRATSTRATKTGGTKMTQARAGAGKAGLAKARGRAKRKAQRK